MEEKGPPKEPSHLWARDDLDEDFDWDKEREQQEREGPRWKENETERAERLRSILP